MKKSEDDEGMRRNRLDHPPWYGEGCVCVCVLVNPPNNSHTQPFNILLTTKNS